MTEDEQLIDQVVQLVEDGQPVDRLTCLPASDSVIVLDIGSRDGRNHSIALDRTGACDIAFDDRGSAARIDVPALPAQTGRTTAVLIRVGRLDNRVIRRA